MIVIFLELFVKNQYTSQTKSVQQIFIHYKKYLILTKILFFNLLDQLKHYHTNVK